jgi:hypothetical protein
MDNGMKGEQKEQDNQGMKMDEGMMKKCERVLVFSESLEGCLKN